MEASYSHEEAQYSEWKRDPIFHQVLDDLGVPDLSNGSVCRRGRRTDFPIHIHGVPLHWNGVFVFEKETPDVFLAHDHVIY